MQITEIFDSATGFVALAALVAIALLLPLYLSQRRDVQRMRAWMDREPGHPATDIAASEAILDHAERELEELLGPEEAAVAEAAPESGTTPSAQVPAATRVTHERPALERITMERAALEPHQQLRRFGSVATQPRWLAALAVGAFLVAGAAIIVVQQGLLDDDPNGAAAVDRGGIEVAVLNTTSADGLGGRTSRQIEDAGYLPGDVESFLPEADQTVVMYQRGQERSAKRVARDLGDPQPAVQKIDRDVEEAVPTADVVVILGQDRVSE
jgi:hypothetical protein